MKVMSIGSCGECFHHKPSLNPGSIHCQHKEASVYLAPHIPMTFPGCGYWEIAEELDRKAWEDSPFCKTEGPGLQLKMGGGPVYEYKEENQGGSK